MTQNRAVPVVVGLLVVLFAASLAHLQVKESANRRPPQTSGTPSPSTTGSTTVAKTPAPSGVTMAQVATHNTPSDCWTTINGSVYDLTAWISQHPGGEQAILSLCGIDGSAAFNSQHGSDRRPQQVLATFKKGDLIK